MSKNEKLVLTALIAVVIYILAYVVFKEHIKSKCLEAGYDRSSTTFDFKGYCIRGNVNPDVVVSDNIKQ